MSWSKLKEVCHLQLFHFSPLYVQIMALFVSVRIHVCREHDLYAKIVRQSEKTWAFFHKRVSSMQFAYSNLFPAKVYSFLDNKAKFIGSSIGYLLPFNFDRQCICSWKSWCSTYGWDSYTADQPLHHLHWSSRNGNVSCNRKDHQPITRE